jgi:TolC family type I secretion outer membrane protein
MSVRHLRILVSLLAVTMLPGCAELDPWSERSHTPISPSSAYLLPLPSEYEVPPVTQPLPEITNETLTLARCIEMALERNPQTRSSWEESRSVAAAVGQAKSSYLPSADFSADATRANPVELEPKEPVGSQNLFDAGFGVRYLLFDAGRSARVKGAEAQLFAADFRHNATLQDLALTVEEHYYTLLAAQWLQALAQETVKQNESHLALAEARYKTGMTPKSDTLKARTEKANADLGMVRANSAVRVTRGRLANVMGLRVTQSFQIVELPEGVRSQELADIEQLLDEAGRSRPELKSALAQIEAQRSQMKSAQARYLPTVSASAGYGWLDDKFVPRQDQWSIGLSLDLPLFTGFDRGYQVQRARADLARAVADRENLLRGVELEVWTAYSQVIEAGQAIEAAGKLVASAEESARVAEGEYKSGTGSIIELIDAQTARTSARTNLIQARLDWYTAMAQFERAVGRTLAGRHSLSDGRTAP